MAVCIILEVTLKPSKKETSTMTAVFCGLMWKHFKPESVLQYNSTVILVIVQSACFLLLDKVQLLIPADLYNS